MTEKFQIINASAGSGKTFSLASNVIMKLLSGDEDSYKKILALTFTNNSANEMKNRILDELSQISKEPSKSPELPVIRSGVTLAGLLERGDESGEWGATRKGGGAHAA